MAIDNEVISIIKDFVWAPVLAVIGYTWREQNKKISDVRSSAVEGDNALRREVDRQRDIGSKLFDKLDEHGKRSEDRHIELLKALHTGLAQKVDK